MGLVDVQTGRTKLTFANIQQKVLHDVTAGSMATPLNVTGAPLAGKFSVPYLASIALTDFQFSAPVHRSYFKRSGSVLCSHIDHLDADDAQTSSIFCGVLAVFLQLLRLSFGLRSCC